jgi:hypothetical protein
MTPEQRIQARQRFNRRCQALDRQRGPRLHSFISYSDRQRIVAEWRTRGKELARNIALARKEGPASAIWFKVFNVLASWGMRRICARLNGALVDRLSVIERAFSSNTWRRVAWQGSTWFNPPEWHFVHASVVDPALVAYYPSVEYLLAEREVRIRPGKYLQQHFSDALSEKDIREQANKQVVDATPPELHFVENTDPAGWEWVYEHGHGFSSCMVYNRSGRYLAEGLYDDDHPVRAYARPGNGLRLAWLGENYMEDDGQVFARAIVRNNADGTPRGYIRTYGDDSALLTALTAAGYGDGATLYGVELNRRDYHDNIICPYLDSGEVEVYGGHLEVVDSGIDTNSDGLLEECEVCEDCGCHVSSDNVYWVGRDEDYRVCRNCIGSYTWVCGYDSREYYVHDNNVVWVESSAYDEDYLEDNDILACEDCGEHFKEDNDDLHDTKDGLYCEDCATHLDIYDDEGNCYAHNNRVTTDPEDRTFRTDEGEDDELDGTTWHRSYLTQVDLGNRRIWLHHDNLRAYADHFHVVLTDRGPRLCTHAAGEDFVGLPLTAQDWSGQLTNVRVGDESEFDGVLEALWTEADDDDEPEDAVATLPVPQPLSQGEVQWTA